MGKNKNSVNKQINNGSCIDDENVKRKNNKDIKDDQKNINNNPIKKERKTIIYKTLTRMLYKKNVNYREA